MFHIESGRYKIELGVVFGGVLHLTDYISHGFHSLTPHLTIKSCTSAIEFYRKAFDAKVILKVLTPDEGKVIHGVLQIGDSQFMLADEFPQMGAKSPDTVGGTSLTLQIYTDDADRLFKQALDAGAREAVLLSGVFWGDRYGQVLDPFGHRWAIATHQSDVNQSEFEKAAKEYFR